MLPRELFQLRFLVDSLQITVLSCEKPIRASAFGPGLLKSRWGCTDAMCVHGIQKARSKRHACDLFSLQNLRSSCLPWPVQQSELLRQRLVKTGCLVLFLKVQFYWMLGPLRLASSWFAATNLRSFSVLQLF